MTSPIKTTDREDRVDAMWSLDDNERRLAIVRRASAGARKTLAAKLWMDRTLQLSADAGSQVIQFKDGRSLQELCDAIGDHGYLILEGERKTGVRTVTGAIAILERHIVSII